MAKPPRKSPGVGRGGEGANLADPAAIRSALAIEILDKEKIAEATEIRKRHRKRAEANGVVLADLDDLFKMKDMAFSDIVIWFKRKFNALGAVFDLGTQFELFSPVKGAKTDLAAFRQAGLMAGLNNKDPEPPPGLAANESSAWLEGHAEGNAARWEAWALKQQEEAEAKEKAEAGRSPNQPQPPADSEDDTTDRDPPVEE